VRIHIGCQFNYDLPQPTPMILLLNVHFSRSGDLERPDMLVPSPAVPVQSYRDGFGNWCSRLVAPAGRFTVSTDSVIRYDGKSDPVDWSAIQHPVEDLSSDTLTYLLGSRYCETDTISNEAWRLFEATPPGWARVQAVCDFVHNHITFGYEHARATRTAMEAYQEGRGVCRDYTHLAIAFCRALNIPARYCTGYLSDIGQPPPYGTMDFAAWMEVYLGNRWWVFDPRNNNTQFGRVMIAFGRDAADVPMVHTFGPNTLAGFKVWADEVPETGPANG
jgi:transglutaminase-like putative cysteine protease